MYVHMCTYHGTMVHVYVLEYVTLCNITMVQYTCTIITLSQKRLTRVPIWYYNDMSQLSDWKRAHMCTENHMCFGRIHGSQLREGANAGQHTHTLSLPPSHHCLNGEAYRGNRHYNVCEHVGLDTNQSLHYPPERDVLGWRTYVYNSQCTCVPFSRKLYVPARTY
jgi:hypothetical protein